MLRALTASTFAFVHRPNRTSANTVAHAAVLAPPVNVRNTHRLVRVFAQPDVDWIGYVVFATLLVR